MAHHAPQRIFHRHQKVVQRNAVGLYFTQPQRQNTVVMTGRQRDIQSGHKKPSIILGRLLAWLNNMNVLYQLRRAHQRTVKRTLLQFLQKLRLLFFAHLTFNVYV